jgi:hypothetical protein
MKAETDNRHIILPFLVSFKFVKCVKQYLFLLGKGLTTVCTQQGFESFGPKPYVSQAA